MKKHYLKTKIMKKLFNYDINTYGWLAIVTILLIIVLTSCKKQDTKPQEVSKTQSLTGDRCIDSGICAEGYYECKLRYGPGDTNIYQAGTNIPALIYVKYIKWQCPYYQISSPEDQRNNCRYIGIPQDFNSNILTTDTNKTYICMKTTIQFSGEKVFWLYTKNNNYCLFKFKHY